MECRPIVLGVGWSKNLAQLVRRAIANYMFNSTSGLPKLPN
jgi:hypothetical protein